MNPPRWVFAALTALVVALMLPTLLTVAIGAALAAGAGLERLGLL